MAVSRRRFLHAVAVAAAPFAFLARVQTLFGLSGDSVELEPTPAVGEQLELTAQETAGAFFQPDSSLKADFREAGLMGVPTRVSGFVLDRRGKPIYFGMASKKSRCAIHRSFWSIPRRKQFKLNFIRRFGMG